jgi:hypothetical protein
VGRLHGVAADVPVFAPHAFAGGGRACTRCAEPSAHVVGERPLAIGGLRCGRCVRRGESAWCGCSRARNLADMRELLHEARVMRRDPQRYYHAADVAIRLAGAGAIRRTLAITDPRAFLA